MFLRFRCLDLNTRHNYFTSLRFCFQGCLQRHLDFGAADKDHLYFLFRFHHYAFDDLTDELKLLREKRKDPQHWIFCFQGTVKPVLIDPFTLQRTFFERISGSLKKFF